VFSPYNSPYTLPIPASARPSAVTVAPSVNYPQAGSGGVMALANATTNFALRFTGDTASFCDHLVILSGCMGRTQACGHSPQCCQLAIWHLLIRFGRARCLLMLALPLAATVTTSAVNSSPSLCCESWLASTVLPRHGRPKLGRYRCCSL